MVSKYTNVHRHIRKLLGWCSWLSRVLHTHEVTSSILVSSTFFCFVFRHGRKFGRVVKAVALGAILVRGRGSNPLACIFFCCFLFFFLLLGCGTGCTKPCTNHLPNRYRARGLVVMIVACQVIDPGSIPGERTLFVIFFAPATEGFLFVTEQKEKSCPHHPQKKKQKVWRTRVSIPVPHAC